MLTNVRYHPSFLPIKKLRSKGTTLDSAAVRCLTRRLIRWKPAVDLHMIALEMSFTESIV